MVLALPVKMSILLGTRCPVIRKILQMDSVTKVFLLIDERAIEGREISNVLGLTNGFDGFGEGGLVKRVLGEEFNCLLDRGWLSLIDCVFKAFCGPNGHP